MMEKHTGEQGAGSTGIWEGHRVGACSLFF